MYCNRRVLPRFVNFNSPFPRMYNGIGNENLITRRDNTSSPPDAKV